VAGANNEYDADYHGDEGPELGLRQPEQDWLVDAQILDEEPGDAAQRE